MKRFPGQAPWSMDLQSRIRSLVGAAGSGEDNAEALTAALRQSASDYGFANFVYYKVIFGKPGALPYGLMISTLPTTVTRPFISNKSYRHDVHFRHMLVSSEPLDWSANLDALHDGRMTGMEKKLLGGLYDAGFVNGLSVPLQKGSRFVSGMSLMSQEADLPAARSRAGQQREAELSLMAEIFAASLNGKQPALESLEITPRELEVLKWASEGYLAKQIAAELNTSPHTVAKQSRSAQLRLGANTLPEAVARAILLGIID